MSCPNRLLPPNPPMFSWSPCAGGQIISLIYFEAISSSPLPLPRLRVKLSLLWAWITTTIKLVSLCVTVSYPIHSLPQTVTFL